MQRCIRFVLTFVGSIRTSRLKIGDHQFINSGPSKTFMQQRSLTETPYGDLPPAMRILFVSETGNSNQWFAECLSTDSALDIQLETVAMDAVWSRLREEAFDCLVLHDDASPQELSATQESSRTEKGTATQDEWDIVSIIDLIRTTAAANMAIVVLGSAAVETKLAACLEASADAYLCQSSTNARALLWTLARASERQRMLTENATLRHKLQQHSGHDHQQALHQIRAQRGLLVEHVDESQTDPHPPAWLVDRLFELLRIYVVTGSGRLREDVAQLVEPLEQCEVTLAETLMAHCAATQRLVQGLGNRPAWHILGRANLLAYELVMQMSDRESVH